MKPQEALNLLDNAAQQYKGSRSEHIQIQDAVQVLREAITPVPKPEKKSKNEKPSA